MFGIPLNTPKFEAWFDEFCEKTDGYQPSVIIAAKIKKAASEDDDELQVSIATPNSYSDDHKLLLLLLALVEHLECTEDTARRARSIGAVLSAMMDTFPRDTIMAANALIRKTIDNTRGERNN